MSRSFDVILTPQPDGGVFVECPSLPGCYSQGDSRDEVLANIREAILLALEDLEQLGEPIPEVSSPVVTRVSIE